MLALYNQITRKVKFILKLFLPIYVYNKYSVKVSTQYDSYIWWCNVADSWLKCGSWCCKCQWRAVNNRSLLFYFQIKKSFKRTVIYAPILDLTFFRFFHSFLIIYRCIWVTVPSWLLVCVFFPAIVCWLNTDLLQRLFYQ